MAQRIPQPEPSGPTPPPKPAGVDWGAALSEHGVWLRKVIYARVGERGAVDEVLQEVALAAVAQKAPLTDLTKVAPWLYRLAVIQSLLYRRKQGRRRKLVDRFTQARPEETSPSEINDPLDWLVADERRTVVRQALAKLSPRDAEILILKYTEDWNYYQIAAQLGISHSAVETRLHRARGRLRACLADSPLGVMTT